MPKYNVHIYAIVRLRVDDVEAPTMQDAIAKADEETDLYSVFGNGEHQEYASDVEGYLVDVIGDTDYELSTSFCKDGKTESSFKIVPEGPWHNRCTMCMRPIESALIDKVPALEVK